MDFDVHPKDDFYLYANGSWLKNNPIPAGYPNWNSFLTLHVHSQENLKQILESLASKKSTEDSDGTITDEERKVSTFFKAAMDEEKIEKSGTEPLRPLLRECARIAAASSQGDRTGFAAGLARMADRGIALFFGVGVSPDAENADRSVAEVRQGGLGLPDRDYYFDEDRRETRDAYRNCIARFLTLLETSEGDAVADEDLLARHEELAGNVLALETDLAEAHMTRTENRDPHATYNKMSLAELASDLCDDNFDFARYLLEYSGKTTIEEVGNINVRNTQAIARAAQVARSADPETLLAYAQWKVAASCATYLSSSFVNAHFNFFEKHLQGTTELKPRWKRAMAFTETALGEALGKLYCQKHFDESSKQQALQIVEEVRKSLQRRLTEVDWITAESTREQALKKMDHFRVKIGYPDRWTDYAPLTIDETDGFLDMVLKARSFTNSVQNREMNAPTDRNKWFMTPQTINAYYHPSLNEVVFPAAILQPPFFTKDADPAVNFGAMGAVVGHEMTHGFDDKGKEFNYAGVLQNWWTEADGKEYDERVAVMVRQADEFEVHGRRVQGTLTSGENIADLGGLRLALRALERNDAFDESSKIDGFTPYQRFFLSWAQCWRQNITKERALQLITIDPHGPNSMRCNGVVSNMAEFHKAFDVGESDAMFCPENTRVDIW
uniref:Peptidase M13 C-terminal domain-containing protein n=1 Tax=Corethron hystrix TaxID=216773 RepID=A0A7S1B631_9STRA